MLGAIMGDICGSPWEGGCCRDESFTFFGYGCSITDDTVCTVAIADALLNGLDIAERLRYWCKRYPGLGYGSQFNHWVCHSSMGPYNSWGNGGAMRVSPCGWLYSSLDEVEYHAERTAVVTHNHQSGLNGALAVATAIWLCRQGHPPALIQRIIAERYGYLLGRTLKQHVAQEQGGVDAEDTVPIALDCGLHATSVMNAIDRAVFIGGDTDTIASMAAAIAEARFGIPKELQNKAKEFLEPDMLPILDAFEKRVSALNGKP